MNESRREVLNGDGYGVKQIKEVDKTGQMKGVDTNCFCMVVGVISVCTISFICSFCNQKDKINQLLRNILF